MPSSSKNKGIVWNDQPLGEIPDPVLARRLGVSTSAVHAARKRRGIPTFRWVYADSQLARKIMQAVPRRRADLVPANHLALMLLVGDKTLTIKEIRDGLGIKQAVASNLVESAANVGRVRVTRGGRDTHVKLGPRGYQEMNSSRRGRRK